MGSRIQRVLCEPGICTMYTVWVIDIFPGLGKTGLITCPTFDSRGFFRVLGHSDQKDLLTLQPMTANSNVHKSWSDNAHD